MFYYSVVGNNSEILVFVSNFFEGIFQWISEVKIESEHCKNVAGESRVATIVNYFGSNFCQYVSPLMIL